jgi:CRP/FNR family transcriptional regulator, cyclic AMP receptor protein
MDASEFDIATIFSGLSTGDKSDLAEVMRVETALRGTVPIEGGDLPSKLPALLEGHLTVHRDGRHLADVEPGDVFGAVGVLSIEPRNASVTATTPVRFASAMRRDLRSHLESDPDLHATLAATAAGRQRTG